MKNLNDEIKDQISRTLHIIRKDLPDEEELVEEDDNEMPASQDFPQFTQTKGRDTLMTCNLCPFSSRKEHDLETHMESVHPECPECRKRLKSFEELSEHVKKHELVKCDVCQLDVQKDEQESHSKMHENYALFSKVLKKGKITKAKKPTKPSAYNVFVKENYNVILTELTNNGVKPEVML